MPPLARALSIAVALLASSGASAQGTSPEAMTEAERDAFRAEVRAYLLEHPEVLMEAISVLEQREQVAQAEADRALVAEKRDALTSPETSWIGGNPEGDVTLVEFMDYRCGYCRQAFADVESLVAADGNIRFVLKEFPILGEQSVLASRFAIAVRRLHGDEAYKQVHDALMTLRSDVTPEALASLAEGFGFDPDPILAEMADPEVDAVIAENRALAQDLQISGTPTFVLGDDMLRGYLPLAQMQALVAQARQDG